jgi:NAD(P)-dependent dehydrogenase (short-subunit alcohol dehydrogenase family)
MLIEPEEKPLRVCVTGGAGGLGLQIAKGFYRQGSRVHICDVAPEDLLRTLNEHPGMHGTTADVSLSAEVREFIREAAEWMGGIDVLVNCAGDFGPRCRVEDIDDEEWERSIGVNLSGAFYCIREVSPLMRGQRHGAIVNIACTAARSGMPRRAGYVAAKAGMLGLTQSVARELGPDNIRCNAILPGMIEGDAGRRLVELRARQAQSSREEAEAELLSKVSMRSWIEPEEVAEMVLYLTSTAGRHVSGQEIAVCGNLEWE